MADDEEKSRSLKMRFGLWLHRILVKLRLLNNPRRNKQTQQTNSEYGWEAHWNILWIGIRTTLFLLLITCTVGIVWIVLRPSNQIIILGTLLVLAGYASVTVWTIYRMTKARREQLSNET